MKTEKTKNGSGAPKPLFNRDGEGSYDGKFDWESIDQERLFRLIGRVTNAGGAIRLGYTRDGKAGSLGVYYGEGRDTVYIRPNQDVWEQLGTVERWAELLPNSGGRAPES